MKKIIINAMVLVSGLLASVLVSAASIGLTPVFPDQVTFNAPTTLIYDEGDCLNILATGPASGACGDSLLSGKPANQYDFSGAHVDGTGGGQLTVVDGLMALNVDGLGNDAIVGGSYSLTVDFDYNGNVTGGSLSILGTIDPGSDFAADFQSGVIGSSSSLVDFGFSGFNNVGSFELIFDNAVGDLPVFKNSDSLAIIVSSTNLNALAGYGDWDPLLNGNTAFFQQSFSGTSQVDTFVPVPGALVLFLSAIGGLVGLRAKRN